ncbi:V-type ATP synthase subunit E [Haloarcula pellucida]|uniref:A-type ATP synthase subunit E n=1 Tax=Haloarcula pellucida TaxID=1427151 RepID=A0A830GJB7_9EURY|nr:V-type ATP synthase subunit E [Halomicroarcula pellucida]MBX0348832.1 V-type ATP synthase subunit E [Halomicroarcula pellucida]GGN91621.1 ATP synthase subunit E [Halomicroarcula pellucida]
MSLDTVVEDIRDEARARADEIREAADERAEEIISEAEADADLIREEREAEVDREIEQEREQRLSSAKLEAKQARLGARRDVLQDVREDVEQAIADLEGDRREELTRSLISAAVEEFDDDSLQVYGRADDQDLIEDILTDYDDAEFAGEYDCLGGVVVESEASRVRVNNTFDSVLESVWEDNLKAISDRLFEAQ